MCEIIENTSWDKLRFFFLKIFGGLKYRNEIVLYIVISNFS